MPDPANRAIWTEVVFGNVVNYIKDRVEDISNCGLTEYIRGEHFEPGHLQLTGRSTLGDGKHGSAFQMRFQPGDVLYVSRNPQLRKAAVADFEGICANTTYVCRANEEHLLQDLLPFIMQTESFVEYTVRHKRGSTNFYLNWSDIAGYEFALPSLEEQRRIAAVLKAATNVRESLQRSIRKAQLLLRSAVDSAAQRAIDLKSVVPLTNLVDPERPICYGILMPGTGFVGGVPVVKVRDYPQGEIIEDGLLLTDPILDNEYKRSRLCTGDLLISIRGTIGRLAFVTKTLDGANITQDTARLAIRPEHDSRYVRAMLESTFVQRQIVAFTTGLAVKGINIGELRKIQVPMVPLEEQQTVVNEVIEVRAAIRDIEERIDRVETFLNSALEELLRETA